MKLYDIYTESGVIDELFEAWLDDICERNPEELEQIIRDNVVGGRMY